MKPCLWYHTADKNPDKSGYYLAYRGWGLGGKADGDSDYGPVYYDKKINEWRDYESPIMGHYAFVYYWTEADPEKWVDSDVPVTKRKTSNKKEEQANSALEKAWADVLLSVERYELIKALSN
jgi:hypothetical protein